MVLLIIIPPKNGYFIGNIPYFQTNPYELYVVGYIILHPHGIPMISPLSPSIFFGNLTELDDGKNYRKPIYIYIYIYILMLKTIVSGSDFPQKINPWGNPPFFLEHPWIVPGLGMLHAASQRPGSGPQRQDGRGGNGAAFRGSPQSWGYPKS